MVKTSFTIGLHNPDCGMAKMDQVCVDVLSTEYHLSKKSCCDNQHQILQLDENVNIKTGKISVNPIFFVSFIHSFTQPLFFAEHTLAHSADYYPPIPDWGDMQVLFQTFLI